MIFISGARGTRTLNLLLAKQLFSPIRTIAPSRGKHGFENPLCYSQAKVLLITHYLTIAANFSKLQRYRVFSGLGGELPR